MDHYIEIRVLPDPEFSGVQLLSALFAKLHRALGQRATGAIGVSFPDAGKTLGERLRLHGSVQELAALEQTGWLKGLRDYTAITEALPVPAGVKHRTVRRVQVKSSAERLRRRAVNKGRMTVDEADARIPYTVEKRTSLPYLPLRSLSNGQTFLLFVEHGPLQDKPVAGVFSSYGLSAVATIPWF
ncbi:type I-F CRISPR-associated endoribonuclease Cas6/Csy4 [Dickeya dadantii]|uniref:type I-F CRISPR-associated endoribonuclease Cas6/Csy4 n=1 Tax=Dickeya dadantii TaxID=204038 RepID=UPI002542FC73|nr:type I-F CRISPR-associated endoribonuclease Cas6/Csy4 [Dickeya dadantii]